MRIGIDMLSLQPSGPRGREIAALSRGFVSGFLEASGPGGHELVLYTHEGLPRDAVPAAPHATLSLVGGGEAMTGHRLDPITSSNPDRLDWLLIPDPFDPRYEAGPPAYPLNGLLMAGVIHDLASVLFPDRQTADPGRADRDARTLARIKPYTLLLAASETTRKAGLSLLGLSPECIQTIGCTADSETFAPDITVPRSLAARRELHRLGVRRAFVLMDARGDGPRGVARRLEAYESLPDRLRDGYQLVMAGLPDEAEAERGRETARDRGWTDAVFLTDPLDPASVRVLLQQSVAFVTPRRYDGVGATVLEAMLCGAAIIAGNTSAPAELLSDAGLLVDPCDPREVSGRLAQILDDWTLTQALKARALARGRGYTPVRMARNALDAIERATRPRSPVRLRIDRPHRLKPRIAVFSPLPPKSSGIADYAARLLSELKSTYTIDVYHEKGYTPDLAFSGWDVACHDARLFDRNDAIIDYHAVVYQMGNNTADHGSIHDRLGDRPGLVTLHDFFLSSYPYRDARTKDEILDAFRRAILEYCPERAAEFVPRLAEWCEEDGGLSTACARRGLFLNRRVFEQAAAVVVHSSWCLEQVRAWLPEHAGKTVVVPMGAEPASLTPAERALVRDRFALGRESLVLASFGFLVPDKLIVEAIDAFRSVARLNPSALFVVVGEEQDGGAARRRAAALGLSERVRFLGRVSAADYADLIAATDLGVNLRRPPSNGETSFAPEPAGRGRPDACDRCRHVLRLSGARRPDGAVVARRDRGTAAGDARPGDRPDRARNARNVGARAHSRPSRLVPVGRPLRRDHRALRRGAAARAVVSRVDRPTALFLVAGEGARMKSMFKRMLGAAWRGLGPIRRPLLRKWDDHLRSVLAPVIDSAIEERLRPPLEATRWAIGEAIARNNDFRDESVLFHRNSTRVAHETDLALNSLVREVVRLQMQLEHLQQLARAPGPEPSGALSLVEADDPRDAHAHARSTVTAEPVMAG